jgi:hypothetical protein
MSTARTSAPTASRRARQKHRKKQSRRAVRPRPGTIPRRLWHEASSCDRRPGRAAGCARDGGAGPRVQELRGADGHGAHSASPSARRGRGRPGLQLPADPGVVLASRHRGGDPDPARSATRASGPTQVQEAERRRAVYRLAQGEPPRRDAVREARDALPRDGEARHDPAMPQAPRSVKQGLARRPIGRWRGSVFGRDQSSAAIRRSAFASARHASMSLWCSFS